MARLRPVVMETPYAASNEHTVGEHVQYARACLRDALKQGDAPLASHLLYTQEGVLDDGDPAERRLGIEAGLVWVKAAEVTVVYMDFGISKGMQEGIDRAKAAGKLIEYRSIGWEAARAS